MSKKDKILIVITAVLVLALIGGFIWDYNKFVLDRTLKVEITDDMEIISMKKVGILYYRKAYEARIRIHRDDAEELLNTLATTYNCEPEIMSYTDYQSFASSTFQKELVKPAPELNTEVAVIKATDEDHMVTFMIDVENSNDAFLYIYYYR
ncbi:MAG: hypothetical protein K6G47_07190 [Clostridia bacterium]|nr:hypothetical protein [Clostridia bacterium]